MSRVTPPDRIEELVRCAARVFIKQGYKRTQMADVAAALGVAKGTLYLYVESKEALFDLVVRYADAPVPFVERPALPVRTPKAGKTLRYVRDRLAANRIPKALESALRRSSAEPRAELEAIVRELYDTLSANRIGIKLLDSSARDVPELAALWFDSTRVGLIELLAQYLGDRFRRKRLEPAPDAAAAARLVLETLVFWAVHRHWDVAPQPIGDDVARETAVHFVVSALAKEER
ncbi:MAG: helix-turn-helix domain-containing protein [Thermodesulfobacteriota bacterium]